MPRSLAAILLAAGLWAAQTLAVPAQSPADRLRAAEAIDPPWQHGDGSDVAERGLELTVLPVDVLADFHGSLDNPVQVMLPEVTVPPGRPAIAMAPQGPARPI